MIPVKHNASTIVLMRAWRGSILWERPYLNLVADNVKALYLRFNLPKERLDLDGRVNQDAWLEAICSAFNKTDRVFETPCLPGLYSDNAECRKIYLNVEPLTPEAAKCYYKAQAETILVKVLTPFVIDLHVVCSSTHFVGSLFSRWSTIWRDREAVVAWLFIQMKGVIHPVGLCMGTFPPLSKNDRQGRPLIHACHCIRQMLHQQGDSPKLFLLLLVLPLFFFKQIQLSQPHTKCHMDERLPLWCRYNQAIAPIHTRKRQHS
jgi:hypothetical protein